VGCLGCKAASARYDNVLPCDRGGAVRGREGDGFCDLARALVMRSGFWPVTTTWFPRSRRTGAVARPMPLVLPVIWAVGVGVGMGDIYLYFTWL
jgi:hypothetical protein